MKKILAKYILYYCYRFKSAGSKKHLTMKKIFKAVY